jgi:hypothetical protein
MSFKMKSFEQIVSSMINWTSSRISGVTDFIIGSKIRVILEAVSAELEEIYWRVYNALFEAQTEGVYTVFDFPRQPATQSTGTVTFYKAAPDPGNPKTIAIGTQVATEGDEQIAEVSFETQLTDILDTDEIIEDKIVFQSGIFSYYLAQRRVYEIVDVTGTRNGQTVTFTQDVDYTLVQSVDNIPSSIRWLSAVDAPTDGTEFTVQFKSLSLDIPVIALDPGIEGNVASSRITVLKGSIDGVDGVINYEALTTGKDLETDSERKSRFSQYVEGLSRGTVDSLRFAAFNRTSTYTISSAIILEQESLPGFVTMYVADSTGTANDAIVDDVIDAVDDYRGAGMVVQVKAATQALVDIQCRLRIKEGFNKEVIRANVKQAILDHLSQYTFPRSASSGTNDSSESFTSISGEDLSTIYLTNIDYTIKSTRPDAIIEADISFSRSSILVLNNEDPAVDKGGGLVGLPCTSHGFSAGDQIEISGSINYDGVYTLDISTTVDELVIASLYYSEEFTGTERLSRYIRTPFASPSIRDIKPTINNSLAEIFRAGIIDVSVWIIAAGDPSDDIGEEGDYYENVKTGDLSKKENGTWISITE